MNKTLHYICLLITVCVCAFSTPWYLLFKPFDSTNTFTKADRSFDLTSNGTFEQYFTIPNSSEYEAAFNNEYTIAVSTYLNSYGVGHPNSYLLSKFDYSSGGLIISFIASTNTIVCAHIHVNLSTRAQAVYSSFLPYLNKWTNIVCQKEHVSGTTYRVKLWVDGTLMQTSTSINFAGDASKAANFIIGSEDFDSGIHQVDGYFLQVGLWNSIVSGSDIYNEGIDGNWNNVSPANLILFPVFNSSTNLEVANGIKSYHGDYISSGIGVGTAVSATNAANLSTFVP